MQPARRSGGGLVAPNDRKMKELILYVASRCETDDRFGAIKLNKILFFSDFSAYVLWGRPITGHEYQALKEGPAPRRLLPIREEMVRAGDLTLVERKFYGKTQVRAIARRPAALEVFTADEIALVDSVIGECWDDTGADVSGKSHHFIGWKFARRGETIPYEVALVGQRGPSPEEIAWGLDLEPLAAKALGQ